MQKLADNKGRIYIFDKFTGEYRTLADITGLTIVDDNDLYGEVIELNNKASEIDEHFFKEISFSCEIENAAEFEKNIRKLLFPNPQKKLIELFDFDNDIEKSKPNPVFVPKHIARRRKW